MLISILDQKVSYSAIPLLSRLLRVYLSTLSVCLGTFDVILLVDVVETAGAYVSTVAIS